MTAIVILSILALIAFLLVVSAIGYLKQFKVKEQLERNKELLDLLQEKKSLVGRIEKEALQYGYPSDPLAYSIVSQIQEAREKENS